MEVDDALHSLGRWSRWHLTFFLLLGISAAFPAAWHMMAIVFLGELSIFFQTHLCHVSRHSCMHLSIVGLAVLFLFSPVCPQLAFFSLCAPLSLSSHGRTLQSFFCNFIGRLHHSCCPPSNVFISDLLVSILQTAHLWANAGVVFR